jgi:hypothetical protein
VPALKPDDGDPDHVPGPQLALGVGNDGARAAYTRAAVLVVDANRLAGRALAPFTGRKVSDGYRRPARGDELPATVDSTWRRLRKLLDLAVASRLDGQPALDAHAAAVALVSAHAALKVVLRDDGGTEDPAGDRRCNNPNGCPNKARPGGKECPACNQYRLRNKGRHRIPRRWTNEYDAQARRRDRGEDHAANPLPGYRYVDGELEDARPHPEQKPRKEAS